MNNVKSNTRGSEMRRLTALLLLALFCVVVFAPPAAARGWDPNSWPFPAQDRSVTAPSGDDGGWNDQDSKSGWDVNSLFGCFDIRVTAPTLFLYFFDLMDVPDSPDQGNGNDRQSLDRDRRTSPQ